MFLPYTQDHPASSLYTLPVFDTEACQVPLHSSGSPVASSTPRYPPIGRERARQGGNGGRICQKSRHGVPRANCRYNLRGETEIPGC